ncbi:DNA methyltransferase [Mesorhizobium sp.]|uniref:site-specific DNA-methyltransferase n=1 Tax=Mesorhizobium sp. TaxID=1871066 RepID=UPI0025F0C0C0|nr:DNA methyltransferase [Mesorhizobium sp.]
MKNHLEVQLTSVSELKVSPFAARNHPREQRRKLTAHVRKYGVLVPLLIEQGGFIVDGHARLEAARDAGLTHVLTINVAHLAEPDRRAVRLAMNRLAEGGKWDKEALARELNYLLEVGYDVELTGFDTLEIESVIEVVDDPSGAEEHIDAKMVSNIPVSRHGDLWDLGEPERAHRIACGDFRDQVLLDASFQSRTAAISFTDPPYNVPIQGFVCGLGRPSHNEFAMASGEMSRTEFQTFLSATLSAIYARMSESGLAYVCMDWRSIAALIDAGQSLGLELLNLAVWVKTNAGMGSFLRSQHELVAIFKRPGMSHRNNVELGKHGRSRSNVWHYRGVNVMGPERHLLAEHPTVKPSAMVADAIRDASIPGDIVFDPFLGSGTTLIAAERTRRICVGIEIEPTFVDLAIRRWRAETGKDAVRVGDGMPFDEAERSARAERKAANVSKAPPLLEGPKTPGLPEPF